MKIKTTKKQEEILMSKKRLSVFPVVRHTGKKNYYRSIIEVITDPKGFVKRYV